MKNFLTTVGIASILTVFGSVIISCSNSAAPSGGSSPDPANSDSAIAAAVASGASAQASGQNVGFYSPKSRLQQLEELLNPVSDAWASTACPTYLSPQGATCSGSSMTLTYSDCSFDGASATWTGGQVLTFGGGALCGTTDLPIETTGETLTRTFVGTGSNATTRTASTGLSVSLDSTTSSGYLQSVSGGAVITGNGTGHTINIEGLHLVSAIWDHTASTVSGQPLTVVSPGANRTIQSGAILLQHNLALYTATAVFNDVAFDGTSCFPQSGTITTTFAGSLSGQETLTFNGGGSATLVTANGATEQFNLIHCF